ncbi:hypothetical protein C8R45DRAFT_88467 [Mycena sanguinolenta]|nr:hypothetical protein C8R45DRAFT_88467 [Mycena sanguinolenta]
MTEIPRLPPELEREILETTAHLYPDTIPQILRVARRCRSWIEPMLYERVSIPGLQEKSGNALAILRALSTPRHSKSVAFFSSAVRHLYLFAVDYTFFVSPSPSRRWSNAELDKVLRACAGVRTLLLIGGLTKPAVLPMLADMRPRRLALITDLLSVHLDLALPFFRDITHLLLGDHGRRGGVIEADWAQLHNLTTLPSLTHLALSSCTAPTVVRALLAQCAELRGLIVCFTYESLVADFKEIRDHRLVFMTQTYSPVEDWELGTRGGRDLWMRADEVILCRQREDHHWAVII